MSGHTVSWKILVVIFWFIKFCDTEILCSLTNPQSCNCVRISQSSTSLKAVYENTVSLTCRVDNVIGPEVQWTKGGVALGDDPAIPGYPRYSMSDNSANSLSGNYDLTITNVQLEDEDTYQCQVTNCNIQSAPVNLTVLGKNSVPPYGPVIIDENEGIYEVVENNQIKIKCEAWNAKPVADVSWFKGNEQIVEGVEKQVYDSDTSLRNSSATLALTPKLADDQDVYTCIINNDALIAENSETDEISAQKKDITLTVLVPPSFPTISGYDPTIGTITVEEHDVITIVCSSLNGKPAPMVKWYRGNVIMTEKVDEEINLPDEYGRQNVSAYLRLIGNTSDDNVRYTCNVINEAISSPYSISFILKVSVPLSPAAIVGIVIGVIIFLVLLVLLILLCHKKRKEKRSTKYAVSNQAITQQSERTGGETIHTLQQQATVGGEEMENPASSSTSSSSQSGALSVDAQDVVSALAVIQISDRSQGLSNTAYVGDNSCVSNDDSPPVYSSSSTDSECTVIVEADPPDGDVFSLSSSLRLSDRGSPVEQISEYMDILSLQTDHESWSTSIGSTPQHYSLSRPNTIFGTQV